MKRIKNSNSTDGNNLKTKTVEDQKTVTNIKAPILSPSCSRRFCFGLSLILVLIFGFLIITSIIISYKRSVQINANVKIPLFNQLFSK